MTDSLSVWKCKECGSTKKSSSKDICHNCYMRKWGKTPKIRKYYAEKIREWAHNNRDKIAEKGRKQYIKNKNKALVRANTLHNNKKINICSDCNKKGKTDFHHLSYQPNLFIEICKSCHVKRHGGILYAK